MELRTEVCLMFTSDCYKALKVETPSKRLNKHLTENITCCFGFFFQIRAVRAAVIDDDLLDSFR